MTPQFKFTLTNSLYPNGVSINQPVGWKEVGISLRRDPNYHSLVEYFESSFIWYGKALDKIMEIRNAQGINAVINIKVQIKTGASFEDLFSGALDLSLSERIFDTEGRLYKIKMPLVRDSFWTRFVSKADTKVDLQGTVDLFGGVRSAVVKTVTQLPTQIIRKLIDLRAEKSKFLNLAPDTVTNGKGSELSLDVVLAELPPNLNTVKLTGIDDIIPILTITENGVYSFDLRFEVSLAVRQLPPNSPLSNTKTFSLNTDTFSRGEALRGNTGIDFYIQIDSQAPIALSKTDYGVSVGSSVFAYTGSAALLKGSRVKIYCKFTNNLFSYFNVTCAGGSASVRDNFYCQWVLRGLSNVALHSGYNTYTDNSQLLNSGCATLPQTDFINAWDFNSLANPVDVTLPSTVYSGITTHPSYIKISALTEFDPTETDSYLIKDAGESIVSKIVGADNKFTSTVLTACRGLNVIMRGKHVRGYKFADKPFTMSWNEWFKSVCRLYSLGAGYTNDGKIEVEAIADFYSSTPSLTLDSYSNLVITEDQNDIYNKLVFQFSKWSAESGSGIDDPQTKREWTTPIQQIGKEFTVSVEAYCASLGIEQTRRNRVELGKDWRLDEDLMLIAVKLVASVYTAELQENFTAVTNLISSNKRYNLRHTPARLLQRWKSFMQSVLYFYSGNNFVFSSGEGNFSMASTASVSDCEAANFTNSSVGENANVAISSAKLFVGEIYSLQSPMTHAQYKTIVANRKNCIQVNVNGIIRKFAIVDLKFVIAKGYSQFKLKPIL